VRSGSAAGSRALRADQRGRFRLDHPPVGWLRLAVTLDAGESLRTEWIAA
jgi:hypothetical protein